jgi:RAB6A-GEF complex partner protein 2
MDISASLAGAGVGVEMRMAGQRGRRAHSRTPSFSSSLISLLSSSVSTPALATSGPWVTPHHSTRRNVSAFAGSAGAGDEKEKVVDSEDSEDDNEKIDPDIPLPTFEVQSAMLAVDLELAPGESRSCAPLLPPHCPLSLYSLISVSADTYTVDLPENLPPTYRGRAMRFSYEFAVGTCKAADKDKGKGKVPAVGSGSTSRVMKVPIRVYNHVVGEFLCSGLQGWVC